MVLAVLALAANPTMAQGLAANGTLWLRTAQGRLKTEVFASARRSGHPRLVVVLHGDAPHERPDYQYRFAKRAAAALDNAIVVAILRPGYTDPDGDTSDGARGLTTGDNYTPEVLDALASAVTQLTARYGAGDVTLVGHSGGAVLAADLLERRPSLATRALLVGCPCDLSAWRRSMARKQVAPIWLLPVRSVSPMTAAQTLRAPLQVVLLVGANDDVAPARFSRAFAAAARQARVAVQIAPGLGHDILLDPAVLKALVTLEGS